MKEICDERAEKGRRAVDGHRTMMTECLKTPWSSLCAIKKASNNRVKNEVKGFRRKLSMNNLRLSRHLIGGK
jgi:hypothetical protein